ncbi:BTB/POZ domain-containing protein [Xylariaceae sp. FL0662B]|nr:BTB/POZ domain-containing protein [Xylariaceae sp. FL0662B]
MLKNKKAVKELQRRLLAFEESIARSQADSPVDMADSSKPLVGGIAKLFNNPEHADTKIHIGSFELPAHEVVLAVQSPFFKKALGGSFQESKTKEFSFTEGSAHAHWRVFNYMYTGKYSREPSELLNVPDDDELAKHVRVYVTADFFLMDKLKVYALKRLKSELDRLWVSESFTYCIAEIYSATNESGKELRDAVVRVAKEHFEDLWVKKSFQALVREVGDFAVDLVGQFQPADKYRDSDEDW